MLFRAILPRRGPAVKEGGRARPLEYTTGVVGQGSDPPCDGRGGSMASSHVPQSKSLTSEGWSSRWPFHARRIALYVGAFTGGLVQSWKDRVRIVRLPSGRGERLDRRPRERRVAATESLLSVSRSVGSALDLIDTMRLVSRDLARALGADTV